MKNYKVIVSVEGNILANQEQANELVRMLIDVGMDQISGLAILDPSGDVANNRRLARLYCDGCTISVAPKGKFETLPGTGENPPASDDALSDADYRDTAADRHYKAN